MKNTCWVSVLIQVMEPTPQPRVKAAIVGVDPSDGAERMPRFPSQLVAIRWWMEHKARFTAPAPSVIVRGAPQEFHGLAGNDLEDAGDDVMFTRPHLLVAEGWALDVAEDGTPTWRSTAVVPELNSAHEPNQIRLTPSSAVPVEYRDENSYPHAATED